MNFNASRLSNTICQTSTYLPPVMGNSLMRQFILSLGIAQVEVAPL